MDKKSSHEQELSVITSQLDQAREKTAETRSDIDRLKVLYANAKTREERQKKVLDIIAARDSLVPKLQLGNTYVHTVNK